MKLSESVRATAVMASSSSKVRAQSWKHQATGIALAVGAFVVGTATAPLGSSVSSAGSQGALTEVQAAGISADPGSKSAAREAKKKERAEAREAKKKERASRSSKSDDRSLAKAKSAKKGSSGSSVDLGDNDPLEGL